MRSDTSSPNIWLRGVLLAACVTLGAPALAQKSADTLRITWRDAIPDVDPYYNSQRTGMVVAFEAFDCLVYRDPTTMEMKPALATSWKQVDTTTLEFTLREGVTFQNGDPFTAADVVQSLSRESRSGGILQSADRYRTLQDHQGRRHHPDRSGTVRRPLCRQPQRQGRDQVH